MTTNEVRNRSCRYVTISEVLYLHRKTIEKHGGDDGVLDRGLIESALCRARSTSYISIFDKAAALFHGLCMGKCFVDGNERVAFLALYIFLKKNNYKLNIKSRLIVSFIVSELIVNDANVYYISAWLKERVTKDF